MADSESGSAFSDGPEILLEKNDDEIRALIEEVRLHNLAAAHQNKLWERCLRLAEKETPSTEVSIELSEASSPTAAQKKRWSKSRSSTSDRPLLLSADQKCELAQRELDMVKVDMRNWKEGTEKILADCKAQKEECAVRSEDYKKSAYDFERDIVKGAVNQTTGRIMAEKLQKYFDERLRAKDTHMEKTKLKNVSYRAQLKKLQFQLRQKEELGDVLHEVDFSQLKIENQQYIQKIDEKNQELLRSKVLAGKLVKILNEYKKQLQLLSKEACSLRHEILSKEYLIGRIDVESNMAEQVKLQEENVNKQLREEMTDYRVPAVMDYVSEVARLQEVQRKIKIWTRKVNIVEMAVQTSNVQLSRLGHGFCAGQKLPKIKT